MKAVLLSGTCALMASLFVTRWAIPQFAAWGLGQLIREDGPKTVSYTHLTLPTKA